LGPLPWVRAKPSGEADSPVNIAIHPLVSVGSWASRPETSAPVELLSDAQLVRAVREGDADRFGELVQRHQARLFALARRYLRRDEDVADLVQEVLVKAYQRLDTWRGDAPFEHWLMRLATRACLDVLRSRRRRREDLLSDLSDDEAEWLNRHATDPGEGDHRADAARRLVQRVFEQLRPASRMVLTLLELEDRSVKEISALTGWSETLVKVRAFRARAEMRRLVDRLRTDTYL